MVKIGVLISGNGSNLQAIIDGIDKGLIKGKIEIIISNNKDAYGLVRGKIQILNLYSWILKAMTLSAMIGNSYTN